MASVRQANSERCCRRQVVCAERSHAVRCSPPWDWLPSESLRWMTTSGTDCVSCADRALELCSLTGVLEGLPGPEDAFAESEAVLPELLLGREPFGMRLEPSTKMRPAELSSLERQMRIGPPAIRGHDRLGVGEQLLGVILMPIGLDGEVSMVEIEHAPQSAALPGGAPARLVHVQRLRSTAPAEKIVVGVGQRRSGPSEDRVHGT